MLLNDLDVGLNETQLAVKELAHKFARDVMRPAGIALDRLSPEQVIEEDSILWEVHKKYRELGLDALSLHSLEIPAEERGVLESLIAEELGWGDAGLATSLSVAGYPYMMALMSGVPSLIEQFDEDMIGCWAVTEPDYGSDMLTSVATGKINKKPNCVARKKDDRFVINGQKAAWVSNGSIADCAVLFCAVDMGKGIEGNGVFLVNLRDSGVKRGKPLDKIGLRSLNQGELFFDGVSIPQENMIVAPEDYTRSSETMLCFANSDVGANYLGLARAAYEEALQYAQERVQGGVPIIEHQNVRYRLFEMFRKVEAARSLNRRVMVFNSSSEVLVIQYAVSTKVTSTQTAFDVASEALQIFGGCGITKEYPVEKMLRDARCSMIEDGCNYVLGQTAGARLN